jgi:ABC-2 type transport system permease protein
VAKGITSRFRALPTWRPAPVAGAILGDVARYLIAAGLVTVLGVIMGYRPPGGAPGTLAGIGLLLAFALCLSWAWTALGLLAGHPAVGQVTWVLAAAAALLAAFAPPTAYLYTRRA